jgi:hypothetical protein
MDGLQEYLKAHPYFAGGSFIVGGGAGYGLSHHFLDFEKPYAIGAGLATGAGLVLLESYAWNTYEAFAHFLGDTSVKFAAAVAPVTEPVAKTTAAAVSAVANSGILPDSVAEWTGTAETAQFNNDGTWTGQHQLDDSAEKEAFAKWFMSKDGNKTALWQQFLDAVRAKHGPNANP